MNLERETQDVIGGVEAHGTSDGDEHTPDHGSNGEVHREPVLNDIARNWRTFLSFPRGAFLQLEREATDIALRGAFEEARGAHDPRLFAEALLCAGRQYCKDQTFRSQLETLAGPYGPEFAAWDGTSPPPAPDPLLIREGIRSEQIPSSVIRIIEGINEGNWTAVQALSALPPTTPGGVTAIRIAMACAREVTSPCAAGRVIILVESAWHEAHPSLVGEAGYASIENVFSSWGRIRLVSRNGPSESAIRTHNEEEEQRAARWETYLAKRREKTTPEDGANGNGGLGWIHSLIQSPRQLLSSLLT